MKLSELKRMMNSMPADMSLMDQERRNAYLRSLGLEPGEIYQELEMDGPYVDAHRDQSGINSRVNLHSHDFYELLFCRSCDGVEYVVGSERYRLQAGDILVIPPGLSHRPLLPPVMHEPYSRDVVWLSQEFFHLLQTVSPESCNIRDNRVLLRTAGTRWEKLGELFGACTRIDATQGPERTALLVGMAMSLFGAIHMAFSDPAAHPMKAEKPELLDRVMAYVETYMGQRIVLAEVARHFYVSESTISHVFRQKMDISFYRYVTQRRLIAAKNLISLGIPMEAVSVRVGFADYSAFFRAFKQEYGISPRQYRNLLAADHAQGL